MVLKVLSGESVNANRRPDYVKLKWKLILTVLLTRFRWSGSDLQHVFLDDGAAGRPAAVSAPRSHGFVQTDRRLHPRLHHLPRLASRAAEDAAVCRFRRLRPRLGLGGTRTETRAQLKTVMTKCGSLCSNPSSSKKTGSGFNGITPEHTVHISALLTWEEETTVELEKEQMKKDAADRTLCKLNIDCSLKSQLVLITALI